MTIDIYNGDCLEVMSDLINKRVKVDAVITDPPYLINYKTGHRKNKNRDFCSPIKNDSNFDFSTFALMLDKIIDNGQLYIFGSWKTEPIFRDIFQKYWKHKNNIVWVKNNWTAGDLKLQYGQQYELIMYYVKGDTLFREKRYPDVVNFDRVSGKKQLHQNQKPVGLLEMIIKNSTDFGGVVFDPFMGSGSIAVACKNTNRKFIGIELDKKYFDIAKERIGEA